MAHTFRIIDAAPRACKESTHLFVLEATNNYELAHTEVDIIAAAKLAPAAAAPAPLHYWSSYDKRLREFEMGKRVVYNTILSGEGGVALAEMIPAMDWLTMSRKDCIDFLRKGLVVVLAFDPETNQVKNWMQCEGFALGTVGETTK